MSIILGIDPGSRCTGYGVISFERSKLKHLGHGQIRTTTTGEANIAERLHKIFDSLSQILSQYMPNEVAIEQIFMHQNPNSALKLGQARGAALAAVGSHSSPSISLRVAEYAPRAVKQAVVGYGAAQKNQVQHMVKLILSLAKPPPADAADALAIAICHAHNKRY